MPVTNEQRKALAAVASQADKVAELIRQRDQAPIHAPFSDAPRVTLRPHGPDKGLQGIESLLRDAAQAIDAYLREDTG